MKGGAEGDRGWDELSALTDVEHMCGQESREPWELHKSSFFGGVGSWAGCVLASKAIDLDHDRI